MAALKSKIDIDFIRAQGETSRGRIWFQPVRQPIGTSMLSDAAVPADVISGRGSIDLVRLPVGTYRVVEQIDERPDRTYYFALPVGSPEVVQYESIVPVVEVPVVHQYVSKINGVSPNPTTGNIELEAIQGPEGPAGPKGDKGDKGDDGTDGVNGTNGLNGTNGTNGTDGVDGAPGRDGVLKSWTRTPSTIEIFGPCGDSGTWTLCPASYRPEPKVAVAGDRILWSPDFVHQNTQEAAYDIASVVAGEAVRYLSSGTSTPLAGGYAKLYMVAGWPRSLSDVWFDVEAEDLDADGKITLALAYRAAGSGNMMGNAFIPGYVVVANAGPGGVL